MLLTSALDTVSLSEQQALARLGSPLVCVLIVGAYHLDRGIETPPFSPEWRALFGGIRCAAADAGTHMRVTRVCLCLRWHVF